MVYYVHRITLFLLGLLGVLLAILFLASATDDVCLIHSDVLSSSHLPFLVVLLFSGMGSLREVRASLPISFIALYIFQC